MERLDTVQALRAIAAWLVVIAHGALWAADFGPVALSPRAFELLGSIGVLMFFTISGFIMVFISQGQFGKKSAAGDFLRRRIIRIVPLYWMMTAAAAVLILRNGQQVAPLDLMRSLFFIPYGVEGSPMRPILGVGWTLNYEMFFYLLFALTLTMQRGLQLLCAAMLSLLIIGQIVNPVWSYRDPVTALSAWTDLLLIPFLIGVALAYLRTARPNLRFGRPILYVVAGIACLLLMQSMLTAEGTYPAWWRVTVLVASAAIAGFAVLAREDVAIPSLLVKSGDASYSLYLVHPLLFGVAMRAGGGTIGQISSYGALLFFFVLSMAAGFLLNFLIERPLTRWLQQRSRGPFEPAPAAAQPIG